MSETDQYRADEHAGTRIGACLRRCGGLWRSGWRAVGLALLVALAPPSIRAVSIGGPFELMDQHGATRTDEDFRGRYMLIYFGFTHCPDTCPTALLKITNALEGLAEVDEAKAERVVPVFVSVDPERDTPEALRSYAEHFHPHLLALTGALGELEELGRAYGVFFAKVPTGQPGEYLMDHTSFVYLWVRTASTSNISRAMQASAIWSTRCSSTCSWRRLAAAKDAPWVGMVRRRRGRRWPRC